MARADVVICGAGIAGIAAAWSLVVRRRLEGVLLVDEGAPLALTSDKSTECYRNWWPGPGDAMVALTNRSIDLMESLARATANAIRLDRRGYLYLSADASAAARFESAAREAESLGAGPLRVHADGGGDYCPSANRAVGDGPSGADLILDANVIRRCFPWVNPDVVAALHARRCGALSAQQLGMVMLEQARARGLEMRRGRVVGVDCTGGRVNAVRLHADGLDQRIDTPVLVNAAGPFLAAVGRLMGVDVPVACERHAKLTFDDRHGVVPRGAPLSIWCDPTPLPWSAEERDALAADAHSRYLLEAFPAGVHGRPLGAGASLMLYWTYDCPLEEPRFPISWDPHYPEILLRGMSVMIPGLSAYYAHMPNAFVDGGYYTKTRENRPLIGPTPLAGGYLMGAFSGYGIMAAMAAGELLAAHVTGAPLPAYADAFALARYDDPAYQRLLSDWPESGQI